MKNIDFDPNDYRPIFFKGRYWDEYEVNAFGTIRLTSNHVPVRQQITNRGYLLAYIPLDALGKDRKQWASVHRLVAFSFVPNDAPGVKNQVNHLNGKKYDNCAYNLQWCTGSENLRHAVRSGLIKIKYTEDQIHLVCQLLKKGELTYREISELTGVAIKSVDSIKRKKLRADIYSQYENIPGPNTDISLCDDKTREICEYLEQGIFGLETIAFFCQVSVHLVQYIAYGNNCKELDKKHKGPTKKELKKLIKTVCNLIDEGLTIEDVALEMDEPIEAVRKMHEIGIERYR